MVILFIFGLFMLSIVIGGIKQYITSPKPPKYLRYSDYYNYYRNLDNTIISNDIGDDDTEQKRLKLEKDIEFYTAQIGMLEDLERLIEKELHTGSGNEKTNLSRLISIDKQIHTAQQTIDKLNDKLESLD